MRRAWPVLCLVLGCSGPEDWDQPGAGDPTARPWQMAGDWYPDTPGDLDDAVDDLLGAVDGGAPRPALAILTPHAGLRSSGPTAAEVYARAIVPERVILLAPDHWGDGARAAVWTGGPWLVPGHAIAIDDELVAELRAALPELEPDPVPFDHHEEEMQLPFLQRLRPDVRIAPIALFDNSRHHFDGFDPARIAAWGEALAGVLAAHEGDRERVLLLVTTDLTHHETVEVGGREDAELMDEIGALDVEGLHEHIVGGEVSMCGEIPTAIAMAALRALGAASMDVLARGNNLHAGGDEGDVVGYPAAAAWP